jgi:hypothetical protein
MSVKEGGHENLQSDTTSTTHNAGKGRRRKRKVSPWTQFLLLFLSLVYSCCDRRDELVDCLKLEKNRPNIIAGLSPLLRRFFVSWLTQSSVLCQNTIGRDAGNNYSLCCIASRSAAAAAAPSAAVHTGGMIGNLIGHERQGVGTT